MNKSDEKQLERYLEWHEGLFPNEELTPTPLQSEQIPATKNAGEEAVRPQELKKVMNLPAFKNTQEEDDDDDDEKTIVDTLPLGVAEGIKSILADKTASSGALPVFEDSIPLDEFLSMRVESNAALSTLGDGDFDFANGDTLTILEKEGAERILAEVTELLSFTGIKLDGFYHDEENKSALNYVQELIKDSLDDGKDSQYLASQIAQIVKKLFEIGSFKPSYLLDANILKNIDENLAQIKEISLEEAKKQADRIMSFAKKLYEDTALIEKSGNNYYLLQNFNVMGKSVSLIDRYIENEKNEANIEAMKVLKGQIMDFSKNLEEYVKGGNAEAKNRIQADLDILKKTAFALFKISLERTAEHHMQDDVIKNKLMVGQAIVMMSNAYFKAAGAWPNEKMLSYWISAFPERNKMDIAKIYNAARAGKGDLNQILNEEMRALMIDYFTKRIKKNL